MQLRWWHPQIRARHAQVASTLYLSKMHVARPACHSTYGCLQCKNKHCRGTLRYVAVHCGTLQYRKRVTRGQRQTGSKVDPEAVSVSLIIWIYKGIPLLAQLYTSVQNLPAGFKQLYICEGQLSAYTARQQHSITYLVPYLVPSRRRLNWR